MTVDTTLGIGTWGKGSRKNRKNPSKQKVISDIAKLVKVRYLDITPLSIKDLKLIKSNIMSNLTILETPDSRFKAPFIEVIHIVEPKIDVSKVSIDGLKHLITAYNNAATINKMETLLEEYKCSTT